VVASTISHGANASSDRTRPESGDGGRLSRKLAELSDFVTGTGNELAITAVQQVCDAPGARANPLFLYGGVGIGKTHLLEGICRRVRRTHSHLQVMLLSAEAFANHFTEALRQRTLPAFRQRFRNVDILLVDDVEFFEGKQVIQEEFLHTFKQLEALGRQLVVTADRHPRILTRLSDDLTSRFQSGLVCRIENPDLETRRRIATAKAGRLEADFAPEAVAYVAQRFTNSVRELEGALHSLATWHAMTGRRITATTARTILAEMERDCVKIVRVGDVEQVVCRFFGLAADDLRSSRRNRTLSQPRMLAMFLSRKLTQAAYSEIGQHFGGRNHSTVMSAEKKVQEWLTTGAPIRVASQTWPLTDLLESLEQQLRAC
jgi:chromosomal replication initiator protein